MTTLTEAIATGQGVERPFRCTEHDDTMASASVNVVKGLWFCFACHASGSIDKTRAPKVEELKMMMEPNKIPRVYDSAFMELYNSPNYWLSRFPDWACWWTGMGEDPFTGDATFPVHTGSGLLAGVGRRKEQGEPRYLYPRHWSAANSMFGMRGRFTPVDVLMVVEGAGDATAGWEIGMPTLAVYGSGVHLPQYALIARCNPKLVLWGFDMDKAGVLAYSRAKKDTAGVYKSARVCWPGNDPADASPQERIDAVISAVGTTGYRADHTLDQMVDRVVAIRRKYQAEMEGRA